MRSTMVVLCGLMWAACGVEGDLEATAEYLPVEAAPPIPTPFLEMSPMTAGTDFWMTVDGMPPGAEATFVLSVHGTSPSGPCHPAYGVCTSLRGPLIIAGRDVVDASGTALFRRRVPSNVDGRVVSAQVLVGNPSTNEGVFSQVVVRLIGDNDLDAVHDSVDNCHGFPNPDQIDADLDGFGAVCDCDDGDPAVHTGALDLTVDGIDQDCDGTDGPTGPGGTATVFAGVANMAFTVFGTGVPCQGPVELAYDPAATPQITGTAQCDLSAFGLVVNFLVDGTVDGAGNITGELDDQDGTTIDWTGTLSGTTPDQVIDGGASGTLLLGPFTLSFTADEQ